MSRVLSWIIKTDDQTKKGTDSASRNLREVGHAAKWAMGALAGLAGAGGFGLMIKQSLAAGDQVQKLSIRLGASTEALSQYRLVAERAGISFNTFTMGLQRMTRRVAEAAVGTGEARGALQELGVSAQYLAALRPEQQFEILSQALSEVGNESDRVRLAMKLFDSEGVSLLQTMEGGAAGIRQVRSEAAAMGMTLSRVQADQIAAANNSMANFRGALGGVANAITVAVAPTLEALGNWLQSVIPKAIQVAQTAWYALRDTILTVVERIMGAIATMADRMATVASFLGMDGVAESLNNTANAYRDVAAGVSELKDAYAEAFEPMQAFNVAQGQSIYNEDAAAQLIEARAAQQQTIEAMEAEHQAKVTAIQQQELTARQQFQAMSYRQQAQDVFSTLAGITAGVAQHNKQLFKINKVAGIASAILNAYEGISLTMAKYPYPLNIAMAAAHGAAAFAQVQAIRATNFGGGGTGTTPSAAASAPVVNSTPVSSSQSTSSGVANIYLPDAPMFPAQWVRDLMDSISEQVADGKTINVVAS